MLRFLQKNLPVWPSLPTPCSRPPPSLPPATTGPSALVASTGTSTKKWSCWQIWRAAATEICGSTARSRRATSACRNPSSPAGEWQGSTSTAPCGSASWWERTRTAGFPASRWEPACATALGSRPTPRSPRWGGGENRKETGRTRPAGGPSGA